MNNDVIIEEKLDVSSNSDVFKNCDYHYELMTFGGKVKNIHLFYEPNPTKKYVVSYFPNWERNVLYPNNTVPLNVTILKPDNLNEIINFTEKCAEYYYKYTTIPHVRISVYVTADNRLIFGEFTGATAGGGGGSNDYQSQMYKWWIEAAPTIWLKKRRVAIKNE